MRRIYISAKQKSPTTGTEAANTCSRLTTDTGRVWLPQGQAAETLRNPPQGPGAQGQPRPQNSHALTASPPPSNKKQQQAAPGEEQSVGREALRGADTDTPIVKGS